MQNPQLDGNSCFLEGNNKSCVMLIHGFTATTIEVKPFALYLNHLGYNVYCPLLPGHGTSPDDLNQQIWMNWVNIVEEYYLENRSKYEKFFLAGESMGGVIASYLAARHPEISAVMLYAPAIKVDNLEFSKFVRFIKKIIPKKNASDDIEGNKLPWQGYVVHPTKAAYQFYLLQNKTKTLLPQINQPVIIFQGALDNTIASDSSRYIYDNINSTKKELVFLENSVHCILLDSERDFVYHKSSEFIALN